MRIRSLSSLEWLIVSLVPAAQQLLLASVSRQFAFAESQKFFLSGAQEKALQFVIRGDFAEGRHPSGGKFYGRFSFAQTDPIV
jgi:hypothetical protein